MKKVWIVMTAALASAVNAQEMVPHGASGPWAVLVNPANDNGCLMERKLDSGTLIQIGYTPERNGAFFAAYNADWTTIEVGATGQVLLDFGDSRFQGEVVGAAYNDLPGGYAFFNNPEFASEFGRRFEVTIVGGSGVTEVVDLTGSKAALDAVRACQSEQNGQ